ncbi:hypothetical protein DICVIV_12905 [Dictyocaulus viviparus]|uniref:Uncharacterized protein n=1 Tax=Dictyocaulus viviparus TaxID=29172 RepID=A0A0D8X986_DICVI|nr:hypothetical protein DICVIV_12905 [Dictyocaulus viviparus]
MFQWKVLLLLMLIHVSTIKAHRIKRQLSIDDLISKALSLVRPIFDTSQPLQNDEMLKKQPVPSTDDLREAVILGSPAVQPLDDIPLCKGNNRICQFISCSAENFKKDPTFGNIQLAAQVLSDKKLRQAISRFITTIESKTPTKSDVPSRSLPPRETEREENDNVIMDDVASSALSSHQRPKTLGSKTWSSQPEPEPQFEIRNDLVANLTPFPPPPFLHPTPPSSPPLAFPTEDPIIRRQRDVDFDIVDIEPDAQQERVKRDYYEDVVSNKPSGSLSTSPSPNHSEDYYGSVSESIPERRDELKLPLKNCVDMLGIY